MSEATAKRPWAVCPTHGPETPNAWGCPECVAEMRAELDRLRAENEALRDRLAWIEAKAANAHPSEFGIVLAQIQGQASGLKPDPHSK